MEFIVILENDSKNEIYFPKYSNYDDIEVIEPIYDNLKSGEKIKFRFKSNLNNLSRIFIYLDGNSINTTKNEDGIFEKEIIAKGDSIKIGKITLVKISSNTYQSSTSIVITYKVVD